MLATLPDFNFTAQVCTAGTKSQDSSAYDRTSWKGEQGRAEES